MDARLKYRPRKRRNCPCNQEPDSNSCSDDRYLCAIMTSKDVLYPPVEVVTIKPTEDEILASFVGKELAEYREAFSYFDKECKGVIKVHDTKLLLQTLGETAMLPEMLQTMVDISANSDGAIDFNGFLRMIARFKVDTDREEKLREAFRIFDPNDTGYIPANELRFDLLHLGECLTDEQIDVMIPQLDINDDGNVLYEDIIQLLIARDFYAMTEEGVVEEEEMTVAAKTGKYCECPQVEIESDTSNLAG